jgi:hypothetical protein
MLSPATVLRRTPAVLLTGAAIAIVAAGWIAARSWLVSHDNAVQLAATLSAQKLVLEQASSREQQRDAALRKTLASIATAKRETQTPAAIVAQLPQLLPALPEPVLLTVPAPTAVQPVPDAAADIPQADLKPLYDYVQDCRACQARLSTAQSDLTDERSKEAALSTERDAAIKAAKGGTFWQRMKRGAKWLAIGAALGATAAAATHH